MLGTAALALIALAYAQMLVALRRIEGAPRPASESTPPIGYRSHTLACRVGS